MASISIEFNVGPNNETIYRGINAVIERRGRNYATGNPINDWRCAINDILRAPDEYHLETKDTVPAFLNQPDVNLELYTGWADYGGPFSHASYMRLKDKSLPPILAMEVTAATEATYDPQHPFVTDEQLQHWDKLDREIELGELVDDVDSETGDLYVKETGGDFSLYFGNVEETDGVDHYRAEFVAQARTAVPLLIREVYRLRSLLEGSK